MTVENVGASFLVCFDACAVAPYRVVNDCDTAIQVSQVQQQGALQRISVSPRSEADFLWSEPLGDLRMAVAVPNEHGVVHEFTLDPNELGEPKPHGSPVLVWTTVKLGQASWVSRGGVGGL